MTVYAELAVTSNFSFLRGGSHPEELVAQAAALGLAGLGIADRNSVAGVVRGHVAHREWQARGAGDGPATAGLRFLAGVRLVFRDGTPDILAYPVDRAAWGRLTRLITLGNRRAAKGACLIAAADLIDHAAGIRLIALAGSTAEPERLRDIEGRAVAAMPPAPGAVGDALLARLAEASAGLWLAATADYGPSPRRRLAERAQLARRLGLPLIAVNDVLYHDPARRSLQDVLTCIRHGVTLEAAGRLLEANAERHLKPPGEMARLFREAPEAVAATGEFIAGIGFRLDDLRYDYPDEHREGFASAQHALVAYTWEGAGTRFPGGVPETVAATLREELSLVATLGYAPYFLTVHDIVRFARSRGILCQGRGSAANSAICFCLGITEVDPTKHDLLFARFVSSERREPPDIDVDFEHERREEVMQYVYERYGRARAGLAASVITYRMRSALRETGKAFGLSQDMVGALSGLVWGWSTSAVPESELRRIGLDPAEPRLAQALTHAQALAGFPRHLSQHTGGFVITRSRLDTVVPIQNAAMADRTVVEWDKDDLDALGILKVDCLALGMLSCLRRCFDLLAGEYGTRLTIASIPAEEPAVYRMIQRADTLGVFQIESRAQMSMLPRLKPASFYDLVIEVAIVRPGPIQGDMVHPYLRRRQGRERVVFPAPAPEHGPPDELERVLGKTLGVPLFQEQAMKIAIVAAGFTPAEADRLRRAMATFRRVGTIGTFARKMIEGMTARGYEAEFAARCFRQIEGFGEYGFPESHAASFALLVYASCWMKCRYPDVFAAALINAQPMGFYAPAQIVRDAREHGVAVRPADINASDWDCTLERCDPPPPTLARQAGDAGARLHPRHLEMAGDIRGDRALRLGLRLVKGLGEAEGRQLVARRGAGYDSVRDAWLRGGLSPAALEHLAEADAFAGLGLSRREAIWAVRGLERAGDKDSLPLFAASRQPELEPDAHLPPLPPGAEVIEDYRALSLSLKGHPAGFLRGELAARGMTPACRLPAIAPGREISVAGLVLVRQRPGSAKGVVFLTLEDETGIANVIIWPKVFEVHRPLVLGARFLGVTGVLQSEAGVIHVVARGLSDLTRLTRQLGSDAAFDTLARADEVRRPIEDHRDKRLTPGLRQAIVALVAEEPALAADFAATGTDGDARTVLPKGRNFH
jgi:error-prone DNA polymerase